MASIRDLRNRIKSVGSIRQITRAMEMVATTKLRRFQDKAVASRPYAQEIAGLVGRLAAALGDDVSDRPLFRPGAGTRVAVLLVTSDRGLCGAYNSNILRLLEQWRQSNPGVEADFWVYGRKGYQYLQRRSRPIERFLVDPVLEQVDYRAAARTSRYLVEAFTSGKYAKVLVFYTAFESVVRYVPTEVQLLPVASTIGAEKTAMAADALLEPDAATIFDRIVPRYLETRIYNALLESLTSEYASRRVSMKNATDAAKDIGNLLKKIYNRKRQENITKELLDIVGGAEAVK
ncbi:MAG: ATP synthase F1 subunit gamma [Planctomycetes bacterium]|nr:ATP synthase F1 subunit gamma [Planctomycetota bacterium]